MFEAPGARGATNPLDAEAMRAFEADVTAWWRELTTAGRGGPTRDLVALRALGRRLTPTDTPDLSQALLLPSFSRLAAAVRPVLRLRDDGSETALGPALVTAAVALAHVDRDVAGAVGAAFRARRPLTRRPVLDEPRFRTLVGQGAFGGLLWHVLRALRLMSGAAPVGPLGAALVLWFREPGVRETWAATYYGLAELGEGQPSQAATSTGAPKSP